MSLDNFLKTVNNKSGEQHTHTKIGDKKMDIQGGSYHIPMDKLDDFYRVYKKHVFQEGKYAFLTEKQLEEGPILIDVDFRYTCDVETKQHNLNHICLLIDCILEGKLEISTNWYDGQFYGGYFYGYFAGGTFHYGYLNGVQYSQQTTKTKPFIK